MGEGKAADGRACGRGTNGFTPMALLLGCPLIECQGYNWPNKKRTEAPQFGSAGSSSVVSPQQSQR